MDGAASHLADRKERPRSCTNERLSNREQDEGNYAIKKQIACGKVTFFLGMSGVCQADYLTSADQVIPD